MSDNRIRSLGLVLIFGIGVYCVYQLGFELPRRIDEAAKTPPESAAGDSEAMNRLDEIHRRLQAIESEVATAKHKKDFERLYERIDDIGSQIYEFEQQTRNNLNTLQQNLLRRIARLNMSTPGPQTDDPGAMKARLEKEGVTLLRGSGMLKIKGRFIVPKQPLETACALEGGPIHEALMVVDARPAAVRDGLIALGAKPGAGVNWETGEPPTGDRLHVYVTWDGLRRPWRMEDLLYDTVEDHPMKDAEWIFSGSKYMTEFQTGEEFLAADAARVLVSIAYKFSPAAVISLSHDKAHDENRWLPTEALIPKSEKEITVFVSLKPQEKYERERLDEK